MWKTSLQKERSLPESPKLLHSWERSWLRWRSCGQTQTLKPSRGWMTLGWGPSTVFQDQTSEYYFRATLDAGTLLLRSVPCCRPMLRQLRSKLMTWKRWQLFSILICRSEQKYFSCTTCQELKMTSRREQTRQPWSKLTLTRLLLLSLKLTVFFRYKAIILICACKRIS